MRAVALSNKTVQQKVADNFIPLKVEIPIGTESFPLDWPALKIWRDTYKRMGGPKTEGITACSAVSPDLQIELGNTGSAFVWEMFDSTAYDADKFAGMLDRANERADRLQEIVTNKEITDEERAKLVRNFRWKTKFDVGREGRFRLPPKGFSIEKAKKLFEMTGDLKVEE